MIELIIDQPFSSSTAEDEKNYFNGEQETLLRADPSAVIPEGTYRVIDGELCRIVEGVPPKQG